MKFNIFKYKQWLKDQRSVDDVNVDILIYLNEMDKFHGMDRNQLWKEGHIILKEWCDEEK